MTFDPGRALLAATLAVLVLPLASCAPRRPATEALDHVGYTPGVVDEAPRLFAPRDIPLTVHVVRGEGEDNPTTDEDVTAAVDFANGVFAEADIAFYLHDLHRAKLRILHRDDDAGPLYTWAQVRDDAIALEPTMATATYEEGAQASRAQWLLQIAAHMPHDLVNVFVFPFIGHDGVLWGSNCASPFPHNDGDPYFPPPPGPSSSRDGSKGIYCTPGALDGRRIHALPHELGHYIAGLVHTFDVMHRGALATEGHTPADYYDLVYAPDSSGKRMTTFRSRAEAMAYDEALLPLDSGCGDCADSDRRAVLFGTKCTVQYRFVMPHGAVVLDSARDVEQLGGMAFRPRAGQSQPGINVMSYLFETPERTPCELRLSGAQIRLLHQKLHERRGHRDLLGAIPRTRWSPPRN